MGFQIMQRIGIPFALLVLAGLYFIEALSNGPQDTMLIRPVFYLMVFLFCINAVTDLRDILRETKAGKVAQKQTDAESLKKILSFAALAVGLLVLMPFAGFVLSAVLFLYLVLRLFEVGNATILYLMPIGVSIALYLLFDQVFSVPLPKGFLGF